MPGDNAQALNDSMDSFDKAADEFDKSLASNQVSNPLLLVGIDGHESADPSASQFIEQSNVEEEEDAEEETKIPDESRISKALSE